MSKSEDEVLKESFDEVISSDAMVRGNCFNCGKQYFRLLKKKRQQENQRNAFCSEKCYKEDNKKRAKIKHYEVFRDKKYYYIKTDGKFVGKRSLSGNINYAIKEDIHVLDKITKELNLLEKIPVAVIKIIDKNSKYLYSEKDGFSSWKNKKRRGNNFALC